MLKIKKTDITDWEHANLSDFEIDQEKIAQEKLALVSDIPLKISGISNNVIAPEICMIASGESCFGRKDSAFRLDQRPSIFEVDY